MAWYYGNYSCGHEGRVNVTGPTKNRQWIVDRKFEGICPECYEKQLEEERQKANNAAAEKAKEMELPELTGSEKQVAWSNTLRQKLIDKVETRMSNTKAGTGDENLAHTIFSYILTTKTEAKWYIDNRYDFDDIESFFRKINKEIPTKETVIEKKTELEVKAESTVKPQGMVMPGVAEITVKCDKITVIYEKNDEFRMIVKSLGYSWDGIWIKNINELTGSAEDRAAEIGNKLLNAGFPIMIIDEKIREKAVKGEFKAECNRWIKLKTKGDYIGWLAVAWYDKSDMYDKARKLPGSRYSSPNIVVKVQNYKEIEDFANLYGFKFTRAALKAIEEYKEAEKKIEIVNPTKVEKEEPKDGLKEILNSSTDVLDDLKED